MGKSRDYKKERQYYVACNAINIRLQKPTNATRPARHVVLTCRGESSCCILNWLRQKKDTRCGCLFCLIKRSCELLGFQFTIDRDTDWTGRESTHSKRLMINFCSGFEGNPLTLVVVNVLTKRVLTFRVCQFGF